MNKVNQKQTAESTTDVAKKELKYRMLPEGLYQLFWSSGGELPDTLKGSYTSVHAVQRAISDYQKAA